MNANSTSARAALALLLGALLAGCSTAYKPASTFGKPSQKPGATLTNALVLQGASGYAEEPGPGGLIKVTYHGNSSMLMYQVQDYTLYRCAEIAQRERSPYFALYQTLPDALKNATSTEVKPTTLLGIPHAEVYIALRKTAEPGLLSAAEVKARLKPTIDAGAK